MSGRRKLLRSRGIVLPSRWRRSIPGFLMLVAVSAFVVAEQAGFLARLRPADSESSIAFDAGDVARYHDQSFKVVHVVDGDTIDIDVRDIQSRKSTTRIRLWGVDTPEIAHHGDRDMHFGTEALGFAQQTLAGRNVHIVLSTRQTRDRFGRLLAYVFLEQGGDMFNEQLLENGFGYADPRFDHHYEERFAQAERRARDSNAGLWKGVRVADMPSWRQKREKPKSTP